MKAITNEASPNPQDNDGETSTVCKMTDQPTELGISVRNAHIQYKDVLKAIASGNVPSTNVVLNNFNMTVQKGHIYGLLGASGCGKTSILRAIVGQRDLTAGEIRVLGHRPKTPGSGIPGPTVGYMPQDLCLIEEFTIQETLTFFGQLVGMRRSEIEDQCTYFVKFLELPNATRMVSTLSGGQQRRLSFAIALLHSPPVLILDEPTVGVDPLLRESIWEYLTKVVKTQRTTVLITTHYIEEARGADIVGLMRHGKLMAEQNPVSLMESLQCNNLEDVLLKLSVLQSSKAQPPSSDNNDDNFSTLPIVTSDAVSSEKTNLARRKVSPMQRFQVLARSDALSLIRHLWFLAFLTTFTPIILIFTRWSIGRTPDFLEISIFNQETNCYRDSSELSAMIPYGKGNGTIDCQTLNLMSCRILKSLQENGISTLISESESSAKNDVLRGWSWAAMTFPQNFTASLVKRVGYANYGNVTDDIIDAGSIQVTMDQSDQILSWLVKTKIVEALKQALNDVNNVCHNFRHAKDLPIQLKTPIYGGPHVNFGDTVMSGFLVGCTLMFPMTAALSTLLPKKIYGTLERALVAGVTMGEVVSSQFVACLIPSAAVVASSVIVPYIILDLYMIGSRWAVAVILIPTATTGLLIGLTLALVCETVTAASLVGSGFYFMILILSGVLWPVEGIHHYLRPITMFLPITLPSNGIRDVAIKGRSLFDKAPLLGLTTSTVWSLACIAFIFTILRANR